MDFGGLLVLGIVWLVFNLIGQGKGRARSAPPPTPRPRPLGAPDPTQQEGSRLERMLRELERSLEEVADRQSGGGSRAPSAQRPTPATRLPPMTAAEEEDVEERDSLEKPEQVVSLEVDAPRRERADYDQDTDAEAIVQRRIEAARARDRALGKEIGRAHV